MTRTVSSIVFASVLMAVTVLASVHVANAQGADERAIREADLAWSKAAVAKDLERTLSFFADDATEMAPNAPMATGRAALRKVWTDFFAIPGFAINWQAAKAEVARAGDLGYSMGTYQLTVNDPSGKPVTDRGKYTTVWKKQRDGSWKVIVDIFNSDLPAPAGH